MARATSDHAPTSARRFGEADVGMRGRDPLHHLPPAQRLLAVRSQNELVPRAASSATPDSKSRR